MTLPNGVTTRTVTFGAPFSLADGANLTMTVKFTPSRSMVWGSFGFPAIAREYTVSSTSGAQASVPLPVTDQVGWLDGVGNALDISNGAQTHTYAVKVTYNNPNGGLVATGPDRNITVPTGDLSPIDLDVLLPVTTTAGVVVSIPDLWSQQLAAAQVAAQAAASSAANAAAGKSAYQVAVDNGFVGTQQQWLASLVGPSGSGGGFSGGSVSGATTFASTLGVTGASTLAAATFNGAATFASTTTHTGAATFASTVNVTGTSTFAGTTHNGPATFSNTLGVTGAATFGATTHNGAATFANTVGITGATTMGALTASGAAVLSSTLAVTGVSTFTGAATLNGATSINNNVVMDFSTQGAKSLTLKSSFAGGDDDGAGGHFDSTSRINLQSYQRAGTNNLGEVIRLYAMKSDSKQMLAWYFPNAYDGNGDPIGTLYPKVWAGAHADSTGHTGYHNHWSVEVPDSRGLLRTRFGINFATPGADDPTSVGTGLDNSTFLFNNCDVVVPTHYDTYLSGDTTVPNGPKGKASFRLKGTAGVAQDIEFGRDQYGSARRWVLRNSADAETGSNAGANFQVIGYDDNGNTLGTAINILRTTGQISLGSTTTWGSGLDITKRATGNALKILNTFSGGRGLYVSMLDAATTTQALAIDVTGDTAQRWVVGSDGKMAFGSGAASRDTTLYRSDVGTLKTDAALVVGTALTASSGSFSTNVNIAGSLTVNGQTVTGTSPTATAPVYKVRTADLQRVSTTAPADDDTLVFTGLVAGATYAITGELVYDGDAAGDISMIIAGPIGSTIRFNPDLMASSASAATSSTNKGIITGNPVASTPTVTGSTIGGTIGASILLSAQPTITVRCPAGSAGGQVSLRWAQGTSSAVATTLYTDSYLRMERIA